MFFLFGMLVGALCYRRVKVIKSSESNIQRSDETVHAEHPAHTAPPAAAQPPVIYEEVTLSSVSPSRQNIELKENVCYGPI